MSKLYLDTSEILSHQEAFQFFREKQLQEGDEIHIQSSDQEHTYWLMVAILIAIIAYFAQEKEQKEDFGRKVLTELFGQKSPEELEQEIEQEYGIKIEVETKDDRFRKEWWQLSAKGLSRAYGDEEPDYSDVPLKEPNPDYKGPAKT